MHKKILILSSVILTLLPTMKITEISIATPIKTTKRTQRTEKNLSYMD